jgi:hypothetical protein
VKRPARAAVPRLDWVPTAARRNRDGCDGPVALRPPLSDCRFRILMNGGARSRSQGRGRELGAKQGDWPTEAKVQCESADRRPPTHQELVALIDDADAPLAAGGELIANVDSSGSDPGRFDGLYVRTTSAWSVRHPCRAQGFPWLDLATQLAACDLKTVLLPTHPRPRRRSGGARARSARGATPASARRRSGRRSRAG